MPINTRFDRYGLDFPFMAAPMVGISHAPFRHLVRSFTPEGIKPLLFSEMLSSRRVPSEKVDVAEDLKIAQGDDGSLVPQLLVNDPLHLERAIQKLLAMSPWGFDINMGCSVKTSLHEVWGSRLMTDPTLATQIIRWAKSCSPVPVSVKTRIGLESGDFAFIDRFTAEIEEAGADWITIHGRTGRMKHRGDAAWPVLAKVRELRTIPIVANGDIQTADDAIKIIRDYSMDGAMLGRAVTARPWVFWQIADKLGIGGAPKGYEGLRPPMTPEEEGPYYLDACARLTEYLPLYFAEEAKQLRRFRFYVLYSHRWYLFGHAFYSRCMKCKTLAEIRDMIAASKLKSAFPSYARILL